MRRLFIAFLSVLISFRLSLWGWDYFYKNSRILGALLILAGGVVGGLGVLLL